MREQQSKDSPWKCGRNDSKATFEEAKAAYEQAWHEMELANDALRTAKRNVYNAARDMDDMCGPTRVEFGMLRQIVEGYRG